MADFSLDDTLCQISNQIAEISRNIRLKEKCNVPSMNNLRVCCNFCADNHRNVDCPWSEPQEQYAYVDYPTQFQGDLSSSTYDHEWRNQSNDFWGQNQAPTFSQPPFQPIQQYTHVHQNQTQFVQPMWKYEQPVWQHAQPVHQEEEMQPSLEEVFSQYMHQIQSSINNLENQLHVLSSIVLQKNEELLVGDTKDDFNEEIKSLPLVSEKQLFEVVHLPEEEFALETHPFETEYEVVQPQFEVVPSENVSPKEKFSDSFKSIYIDMPYSVFPWLFLQKFHEDKALEIQEEVAQEVVVLVAQLEEEDSADKMTCVTCSGQTHLVFYLMHSLLKPLIDHTVIDENWVFKPP